MSRLCGSYASGSFGNHVCNKFRSCGSNGLLTWSCGLHDVGILYRIVLWRHLYSMLLAPTTTPSVTSCRMLERGCLPGCKGVDGYLSHAGHHAGCPSSHVVPYPPRDVGLCCYWACFLLGVGTLLPWNALVSAVDIFSFIYPGANVEYTFAVSYTVTLFIM